MYPRVDPGSVIRLYWFYKDGAGNPVIPASGSAAVSILDSGGSQLASGSPTADPDQIGKYFYDYGIGSSCPQGQYSARWTGTVGGIAISGTDYFVVGEASSNVALGTQMQMVSHVRLRLAQEFHATQFVSYNKFTDEEIRGFLHLSLLRFNAEPPVFTDIKFDTLPEYLYPLIENGAVIDSLIALQILEAGKHFSYSDNGISITRDRHAKYQSTVGQLLQFYLEALKRWKQVYAFNSISPSGQFSATVGYPRSLDRALRGTRKFSR